MVEWSGINGWRSSFGAAAAAYAEHRPDYAPAAVRWALEPAPGPRVLDLGAGTGKLTAALVASGADVVAVEPDPAMLAELRRALPDVRALPAAPRRSRCPTRSVDAVLAGNAMHWFDMAVAGPEIARVLAPGGVLAGLWNVLGRPGRLGRRTGRGRRQRRRRAARHCSAAGAPRRRGLHLPRPSAGRFGSPEQAEFPHGQRRTADSLVATLATQAGMLVMPEPERRPPSPGSARTSRAAGDRERRVHAADADRVLRVRS